MFQRTATIDEHHKIHLTNRTALFREDKRTRDLVYEAVNEWTR
jgi:hypothetical protein